MVKTFWLSLSRFTRLLAVASLVVNAAVALRVIATGSLLLIWMPWNLVLAWVPYGLACWIRRLAVKHPHGGGILVLPTMAWLLFFPNAPYIVTDFIHLRESSAALYAYDVFLITSFTLIALVLGLMSLYRVHVVVRHRLGAWMGWIFVAVVSLLSGAGVWMGRVLRWNSWDVIAKPREIYVTVLDVVRNPWNNAEAITYAIAFGIGLLAVYAVSARVSVRMGLGQRMGLGTD